MDSTTCLKSLLLAINQYKTSKSTANTTQLQKHIAVVSGLKDTRILLSNQILPSECLSGLVEVAGDPNASPALTKNIISLLAHLASDDEAREALHGNYNLTATLASIIHCNSSTHREELVLQCLQLLQRLTYNVRISHCSTYMDELIGFLVQYIQSTNDEVTLPCLGVLANLCRHNMSVQTHIKALSQVKAFYRTLINLLDHNSLTVVVFALSILISLTLNEEVGEKLFHAKNIHQTFQLIFNIIVNGDGTLTRKYAVDLLVDLLKNPKIADYLAKYEHFSVCLSQVLGLLHSKDPDSVAKVLELLMSLCSVPGLRTQLCHAVFRTAGPRLRLGPRKEAQSCAAEAGVALSHWVGVPLDGPQSCCLQALVLLTELFEEAFDSSTGGAVQSFCELLVPVLMGLLQPPDPSAEKTALRRHCVRAARTIDLLLMLCNEDSTRMLLAQELNAPLCLAHMEAVLSSSHVALGGSDSALSHASSEVVLKMLDLMSRMKQQVKDMETSFYRILQDQRTVAPLSHALTSDHREHVQTALRILFEAAPLPDFPVVVLGENITANNAFRHREAELSLGRLPTSEPITVPSLGRSCLIPRPQSPSHDNIHSLIERLQSSVELQDKMKDVRISEIMEVYEQKISALASKEGRLQDLLEAKALALSQADRLIAQYRCQRVQAEAEARRLASLLQEAERRNEELQAELGGQVLETERARTDIQQLLQHNARLQADSQEHQVLKGSYNELLGRFGESERTLKELQATHISLSKQAETLKRQADELRQQQDRHLTLLAEREEQIKALEMNVKQKEEEITGLQRDIQSKEEQLKEREKEKEDMEEMIDILRKELNKKELARKEASIRASSLEVQKSQLESKLQKKEEELNKHSQMIAMIHSLSSGKLQANTLSL